MNLSFAYHKRSTILEDRRSLELSLAPNLRRDRVSYFGQLSQPLRFREAISTLHDIVISDLRYKRRDKSAYHQYLAEQKQREAALRRTTTREVKQELLTRQQEPIPEGFEARFRQLRRVYWEARQQYADYLWKHDPELWRLLMPCDPVITVAPDVLFFECFSADESSYGCLSIDRAAFTGERDLALGTTNVDYSWALYEHFQKLRTYRETRFVIDPAGFEVQTHQDTKYREEKIDLPESWLRGFMQLQAAMSLPARRVLISREGLYNVLAWLKRRRAAKSPRALRFELDPGKPIALVLEPWEKRIVLQDTRYSGQRTESIRTWGRDRLRVLGRLLPLVDRAEVHLLGTGLPSFWVLYLGEMRLTLGLSGWTTNDWTRRGNALDQITPPYDPSEDLVADVARVFRDAPAQTFRQIQQKTGAAPAYAAAALNRLALLGQVIHDLPAGVYRWRQVMPVPLSIQQLGDENEETSAARELVAKQQVRVTRSEERPDGLWLLEGRIDDALTRLLADVVSWVGVKEPDQSLQLLLDGDGRMLRGRCKCSYHHRFGLRAGPCRHLQALRNTAMGLKSPSSLDNWYRELADWIGFLDE